MTQFKRIIKTIFKYRLASFMTIGSLVISFLGMIILVLHIGFEKSFDKYNKNYKSVYRLESQYAGSLIPAAIAKVIERDIPEVEAQTTLFSPFSRENVSTTRVDSKSDSYPSEVLYCDSHFPEVFTISQLSGDKSNLLSAPNQAVLTESFAHKLFGQSNPLGENIVLNKEEFRISGIIKDFPYNSSIRPDCLLSFSTLVKNDPNLMNKWGDWRYNVFMKLCEGANPGLTAEKTAHISEVVSTIPNLTGKGNLSPDFFSLLPLSKVHFTHLARQDNYSYTDPFTLNVLMGLILVLALMGAVNFTNFYTSQAHTRANSSAITRVLGSSRFSARNQVIAESVILSIIAFLVSLAIYFTIAIPVENLFGISGIAPGHRFSWLFYFLVGALIFGLLTSLYPANFITAAPVVAAIKGKNAIKNNRHNIRNVLLTAQFVFAIGLIACAFVMEKQLSYWANYDMGFEKNNVVYFYTSPGHVSHQKALVDELKKNENITDYTYSAFIPGEVDFGWTREVDGQFINVESWPVDANFLDFFGLKMIQGRKFGKETLADENSFILNEKAVSKFGWKNPLERHFTGWDSDGSVIGVVKDFNFLSLKEEVKPMLFWYTNKFSSRTLLLKIKPVHLAQTMNFIKKTAKLFDPKNPVEVKFLDDSLNRLYEKEQKTARFIEFVALWCVLLGLTGLLGLVVFVCKDRTKEIGVRKVNGAEISEVMLMLNKDLLKWVGLAFLISTPAAWFAMHKWLENFAYKTSLTWWIFALAGIVTLGISLLTISWQSWKAATRNPVEALRYE